MEIGTLPRHPRDRFIKAAPVLRLKEGSQVFEPENVPNSLLLLCDGTIRVSQTPEGGRDLVIYRAEAGCPPHEILAVTGRKTLAEVERYTRAADRSGLADSAMKKLSAKTQ